MIVSLQGRDVEVDVKHFWHQPPDPYYWDSDKDFYGYTELEYEPPEDMEDGPELYNCVLNELLKGEE